MEGQLGPLERKSIEPIADAAGVPPRNLQEFLSLLRWDEDGVRDYIQFIVRAKHQGRENVGVIDETSFHKQGSKTACVQRQYCGSRGKVENCVVSIHLAFANDEGFHTLIDSDLYLPRETWHLKRARCRAAGIPKEVVYRPFHEIALGQIDQARANRVPLDWISADERYGAVPAFLAGLEARDLPYVVQVPATATGWTRCPGVWQTREQAGAAGKRLHKYPHLALDTPAPKSVEAIARHSFGMRKQPWVAFRVKETEKGPEVWDAKSCPFFQHRDGLPSKALHLLVVRHVLDETLKYFVVDAPEKTPLETQVRVAFMRWNVERCFEDEKGRIGMHHFEVRRYLSLKRHLVVSMVSHLFLAEQHERLRGGKPVPHDLPSPSRDRCVV